MARKSRELRLSQTKNLVEAYSEAGIGHADRSFRFMSDMISRLERGKGLSTGQRKYLDSLIDQGVPKLKNEARVNEILAASKVDGMQQVASTLSDFAFKLGKGWSLSEKQEKFLANLLTKAEALRVEGRFRPTAEMVVDLENAEAICAKKNGWYWQHRPGTAKAYDKVSKWLDWNRRNKVREELLATGIDESVVDGGHHVGEEPIIDQWVCDKLLRALKNPLKELKDPRHPSGSIAWKVEYNAPKVMVLVADSPAIKGGKIMYPCLINGELVDVCAEDLRKRRG